MNWINELPLILLFIRNIVKEDYGCTPIELIFSTSLFLQDSTSREAQILIPTQQPSL